MINYPTIALRKLLIIFLCLSSSMLIAQSTYWIDASSQAIEVPSINEYSAITLETNTMLNLLASAPLERTNGHPVALNLPIPDGTLEAFYVVESPIMEQGLADKFPSIKTYTLQGIDRPTSVGRMVWSEKGLHAYILSTTGSILIDPIGDSGIYGSYYKKDVVQVEIPHSCNEHESLLESSQQEITNTNLAPKRVGETLREYRIAIATTAEYTQYHGGPAGALAAIAITLSDVNAVLEREVSVRLNLITDNDLIIYTDADTDPYENNEIYQMLQSNIENLPLVIGEENFDIGHVFGSGNTGGVAYLESVCDYNKAGGATGLGTPEGNQFNIKYFAHELGHQFGVNHTWSRCGESLDTTQLSFFTAYEPGSGSTIMSYAGLCGGNNINSDGDDYYHAISLIEFTSFVDAGGNCFQETQTGNLPPVVDAGEGGMFIPIETPFELTAVGSDPDGDALTYCWEQFDLGEEPYNIGSPMGNAPTFRSFPPVEDPTRTFPALLNIIINYSTNKEVLPTYSRDLTFMVTARDNNPGGGGIAQDQIAFQATEEAGPFLVTYPGDEVVTWEAGTDVEITWDVANTDQAPVNCSNVDILMSLSNGQSFPIMLADDTPNDGSAIITVPDTTTLKARIKIKCSDNIFFDFSNKKVRIEETPTVSTNVIDASNLLKLYPNPTKEVVNIELDNNSISEVGVYNLQGQLIETKTPRQVNSIVELNTKEWAPGIYFVKAKSNDKLYTSKLVIQ